jgi:glycosyltransferase involved in cell wall biosynthesis
VRIAFHTPLNAFDDGRISGDRRMARQLAAALARLGHEVVPITDARAYMRMPDTGALARRQAEADSRRDALLSGWRAKGDAPELWFTYHSYYKAPDLLGPEITRHFGIPYVVAEASDSGRRAEGEWARHVALARSGFCAADLHFCFTARDREGVEAWCTDRTRFLELPPFIAPGLPAPARRPAAGAPRLVTVAMMRPGVKRDSYRALATALERLAALPWSLSVIGDGPARPEVEAMFANLPEGRVSWRGALDREAVAAGLATSDIFVWPGIGEAYGLVYLEAQAAGLPVIAFDSGGVSSTVRCGETALLAPEADIGALGDALARLLVEPALRERMGAAARTFVTGERMLEQASEIIDTGLALALAARARRKAGQQGASAS